MGPMMNFGMGQMPVLRQADPGMMAGSLGAAQVAPNKRLGLFGRMFQNPQAMGQLGMGLMQMGQRQPMGGGVSPDFARMLPLMQSLFQRRA